MEETIKGFINHKGYDYKYSIKPEREEDGEKIVRFVCRGAKLNQELLESDVEGFIDDLPNIIDKATEENKSYFIKFRVSKFEKLQFEKKAKAEDLNISRYIKEKCI